MKPSIISILAEVISEAEGGRYRDVGIYASQLDYERVSGSLRGCAKAYENLWRALQEAVDREDHLSRLLPRDDRQSSPPNAIH